MAENLSTSKFRNGEDIFKATNRQEWIKAGEEGRAAWCYIGFNDAHANRGKLYNWYAVIDPRGLAPKGWKVPAIEDWDKLANRPDGSKLKHTSGWRSAHVQNTGPNSASVPETFVNGNGSNSTGFSATPTSHFFYGGFDKSDIEAYFWSTTENNQHTVQCKKLWWINHEFQTLNMNKRDALSVRCMKD